MEKDWKPARKALSLVPNSGMNGHQIIQYAANGLIQARARMVMGASWPVDQDGYVEIPADFWRALLPLTGSAYRNWNGGVFLFKRTAAGRQYSSTIQALSVEFDLNAVRVVFGLDGTSGAGGDDEPVIRWDEPVEQTERDKGGAPTDATKWVNLVAVVASVFGNRDLIGGGDPLKRPELRKIIEDYAATVGLPIASRRTIDPAIDMIIRTAWAEHDNGEPLIGADRLPLRNGSNLEA